MNATQNYNQYLIDYSSQILQSIMKWIILEANGLWEEIDITEEIEMDRKVHSIKQKYHKWDYSSSPHLLLGGESGSGSKSSLWMSYKFLGDNKR